MHRSATLVLSAALLVLGLAMVGTTLGRGGGGLAYGVVVGALFAAAGGLRLWTTLRER